MANGEVTPSSVTINENAVVNNGKLTLKDIKSVIKIGIVNSNLFTVFAGYWLALYFTNASFMPNLKLFLLTMAGSTFVLIGASILNNWYDVDIDPVMDRTKERPTVTGKISLNNVLFIGIISTLLGLILLYLTTVTAAIVAFIGWFTYVVLYTIWSKRRYTLNTEIGCISGAVPPLIGWAAVNPDLFHIVPIALFLIMFIWQTPHFLALAMKNCEEYKAAGIPMLPVVHGFEFTKRQIVVYIACLLPLPFFLGELGITFLSIATLLNVAWLIIGFSGFFMENVMKWANIVFFYSLGYLIVIFFTMIIVVV
ncbi:heme o synthase [Pseudogracilibacillus auburnensis]|uniref:Protoheme IX farnesyltransferase n=1 Tax=Pseudogracilibacillus auburnensis TaxID=1494959 RepID=A0A2V3WAQ9_9BACI|nr:heme o synthase [Pseudogracilibacillus auburnensis]MBO1003546.1 protoheme IX farnesyltransferase [Pseudogracilibacillus auburnensis]PXW89235.1 protoheme IX farnesyltransferase [Pseudogracilibacillus auburnensis]